MADDSWLIEQTIAALMPEGLRSKEEGVSTLSPKKVPCTDGL